MQIIQASDTTHQKLYEDFIIANSGSFLQSWQWGNFQEQTGRSIIRILVLNNNKVVLSAQLFQQTIPLLQGKYWYCPYGPITTTPQAQVELLAYLKNTFPNHWFVRLEPTEPNTLIGKPTIRTQPGKTLVTELGATVEKLLASMHPKTRYNINRAKKLGVTIHKTDIYTEQEVNKALTLITETGRRHKYSTHHSKYYQALLQNLFTSTPFGTKALLYTAFLEQELLCTAITIDFNNTRTYLFGGSSDVHKNAMAPHLLLWQSVLDAKEKGLTRYDWWGIETATGKISGFVKFKMRFGGNIVAYPQAQDFVHHAFWYVIYKVLRTFHRIF